MATSPEVIRPSEHGINKRPDAVDNDAKGAPVVSVGNAARERAASARVTPLRAGPPPQGVDFDRAHHPDGRGHCSPNRCKDWPNGRKKKEDCLPLTEAGRRQSPQEISRERTGNRPRQASITQTANNPNPYEQPLVEPQLPQT